MNGGLWNCSHRKCCLADAMNNNFLASTDLYTLYHFQLAASLVFINGRVQSCEDAREIILLAQRPPILHFATSSQPRWSGYTFLA